MLSPYTLECESERGCVGMSVNWDTVQHRLIEQLHRQDQHFTKPMTIQKSDFLFLYEEAVEAFKLEGNLPYSDRRREEIQQAYAQWKLWHERFKSTDELLVPINEYVELYHEASQAEARRPLTPNQPQWA